MSIFPYGDTRLGQREFFTTYHPLVFGEGDLGVSVNLFLKYLYFSLITCAAMDLGISLNTTIKGTHVERVPLIPLLKE
jgi:hypothetical protein